MPLWKPICRSGRIVIRSIASTYETAFWEEGEGMGRSKVLITLILLLVVLTGGAYGYGVWYFANHFMPGSTVNGYNCSYMTVQEAEALMDREAKAFALVVETQGRGREAITATEVGLAYASDGSIDRMIQEQNLLGWFLEFTKEHSHDLSRSISFVDAMMDTAIADLDCMNPDHVTQPRDAYITEVNDQFVISPEVIGNALDGIKVKECISQAMRTGKVLVNLENEGCYIKPVVYQDDPKLIENCSRMNRMADTIITYDFGRSTEQVGRDLIKGWFTQTEDGYMTLDDRLLVIYLDSLSQKYNTVGTVRDFVTYDGRTIQVAGGDYGWILDVQAEATVLKRLIEQGDTQVRTPLYSQEAARRSGQNDIGYTYVEVDTAGQRLVYYQEGTPLLETECVTGNTQISGQGTPAGVYLAKQKESPKVLTTGFQNMVPVEESFTSDAFASSPIVGAAGMEIENGIIKSATADYWMPFADVGITEGLNRTEYGGTNYLVQGTTGDVEIPYDMAAALYGRFDTGLPVVVY